MTQHSTRPLVAIVGPCGSGKSTLGKSLRDRGFRVREVAQEHSYVPAMWQRITNPGFLVFLDASFEESTRRKALDWSQGEYDEEHRRLAHARQSCDVYLLTDRMSPDEVLQAVLDALGESRRGGQAPREA